MSIIVSRDTKLLFIGDSITDCGRREDPEQLGSGFVRIIRDHLAAKDPVKCPRIINTGISGNRIPHLAERWQRDVINHGPDIVSIMIGINDVWHGLSGRNEGVRVEEYATIYSQLIADLKRAIADVKIIVCEPTVIGPPSPVEGNEMLAPYIRAVNEVGKRVDCVVQTHNVFRGSELARPDIAWTTDGVHPTSAGHMLIARTWLTSTSLL